MKIGIVGGGCVGRATARAFVEHVEEVHVFDLNKSLCTPGATILGTVTCDIVFVCIPTPQKKDSLECDVSLVEQFFREMSTDDRERTANFVLRSTVPIGTTKRLSKQYNLPNLCHSPEFLTARTAVTDAHLPSRNVVGIPTLGKGPQFQPALEEMYPLIGLYLNRFPGVRLHVVNSDESEAIKLFTNGFFATKIAYWNEVNALATKLGLDWNRVMEGVLSDGRISHSHTQVPGKDGYGFGGSCLPKDLGSLINQIYDNGCEGLVTSGAYSRNLSDRKRTE